MPPLDPSLSREMLSILEVAPETYKNFSCGKIELDEYLRRYAKGNHKKGIGKTFVLKEKEIVVGFYTISMGSIEFASIPVSERSGLPKYPIPVAKIGRLAVEEKAQGSGVGKFLLIDACLKIYKASRFVAAIAVVVDAKDRKAKEFYSHFGFIEYQDSESSLFLPMDTLYKLFGGP